MASSETEKPSLKKSESIMKKTTICHCRSKVNINKFEYKWCFAQFSKMSKSLTTFLASGITDCYQAFTLNMSFDKKNNMMYFHSWLMTEREKIKVNYYIYIKHFRGGILNPCEVDDTYLTQNKIIYEISLNDVYKSKYLCDDTLTVCFHFEIIESILHHIMQETIDETEKSAINKFALDKRSGSKVEFVICEFGKEKQSLFIDKGLLCSKSNVFEIMLNTEKVLRKYKGDVIEISNIKYDVYKHFISYLETDNLDSLSNLGSLNDAKVYTRNRVFREHDYTKYRQTLYDLIVLANKYNIQDLLLSCEKILIKTMYRLDVIDDLEFAHLNSAQFLEKYAIKFIKLHEDDFAEMGGFRRLIQNYPKLLIKIKEENVECREMPFKIHDDDPDFIQAIFNC
ncbi:uncharacterized protein LOC115233021 [Formica exsecta]|uniref:uncharacterized protein LOC115233021 n=1 Tax=Formica exsecta TaxID=72781 RepID=UPI0011449FA5|nr:uncharacterized protein LOC115233021 [Formica exsecta]